MQGKLQKILDLLLNPGKFFDEKVKKEISLKLPFIIVLCASIVLLYSSLTGIRDALAAEREMAPYLFIGALIGIITIFLGGFFEWLLFSGVFHVISHFLKGSGEFRRVAEFVAYGFVPSIFDVVLRNGIPHLDPGGVLSYLIGLLFMLWSANIWVFAVKYARNLTTRNAVITVAIPVGAMMANSVYQIILGMI